MNAHITLLAEKWCDLPRPWRFYIFFTPAAPLVSRMMFLP